MYRILFDTNVLVDYYLGAKPVCDDAARIMELSADGRNALYISPTILKDAYNVISASLKRMERMEKGEVTPSAARAASEVGWACARHALDSFLMAPVSRASCLGAFTLRALHDDLEDDLVIATAREAGADFIVSSDTRLKAHAPIAVMTPADMALLLAEESS